LITGSFAFGLYMVDLPFRSSPPSEQLAQMGGDHDFGAVGAVAFEPPRWTAAPALAGRTRASCWYVLFQLPSSRAQF
jgi:hypothetical protein